MPIQHFFSIYLAVLKECYNFAAMSYESVTYSNKRQGAMNNVQGAMPGQKGTNFSVIFVPDYLVVPNNLLTHTF